MNNLTINIIGSGNVAWHLAHQLHKCQYKIKMVYSQHIENAKKLAAEINAEPTNNIVNLQYADVNILSLKDDVYLNFIAQLPKSESIFVHTAGCLDSTILNTITDNYGVLYPFQTFNKKQDIQFDNIPICLEAANNSTLEILTNIANKISSNVHFLDMNQRANLHLAGVFAGNFTNALYGMAEEILTRKNLNFDLIKPLIKETAIKMDKLSPREAQTGPAARKDWTIINKHIAMLNNDNQRNLYRFLSQIIQEQQDK